MNVDFFKPNEQNAPTVENYLFSKELSQVMNGEYIDHDGQLYQVTGQTVADKKGSPHNVFVFPINHRLIIVNLQGNE